MTAPDRHTISTLRSLALTALVAAMLWAALASLPRSEGSHDDLIAIAASLCAVLAMFGLRSVPIRWIVRGLALLSGLLLARFGELGALGGFGGSWKVLMWLAATTAALVLAPSSRAVPGRETGTVVRAVDVPGGDVTRAHGGVPAALVVAAVCLIGAAALLVGPRTSSAFPTGSTAGEALDLGDNNSGNILVASDRLDMTSRPRLTERVVMNVRSPIASFWRTETFDTWDGSAWTRSEGRAGEMLVDGHVVPGPFDLAAVNGQPTVQEFRMEVGFATALPSAPSPQQVDSSEQLGQRSDGTVVAARRPLSRGSTYTVRSAQIPTSVESLRVASSNAEERVPPELVEIYAQPPLASSRTRDLVAELTAGLDNDYDKIAAFEQWMNDNTEYSLDAPLSPEGVDVVDHFLFESRLGWCEQIASSLVVMAREAGIPARLATGFTPGEWDVVGGRFVVRENDAHAWAEVWFPDYGWVTFDPTAQVPLAGTAEATAGAAAVDWREVLGAALAVLGVTALAAGPVRSMVGRFFDQRRNARRRRELIRHRWDVADEVRLERLGESLGRPRRAHETMSTYTQVLASIVTTGEPAGAPEGKPDGEPAGEPAGPADSDGSARGERTPTAQELIVAGERIDRARYAP